jgi:hypothetical protein
VTRPRAILGIVTGALIALSALPHSLMGWPALAGGLAAAHAPADLVQGLAIGWYFGSVAIVAFGAIAVATFARRLRGRAVSLAPARIVAMSYAAFGAWALSFSGFEPFFAVVFLVPGVLLALASFGRDRAAATSV